MTLALPTQHWRAATGGVVLALLLLLVLGTPQGRDAASQFLGQFRNDRLEGASLNTSEIANFKQTLAELEHLGHISGLDSAPEPRAVESVAAASEFVGFTVLEPDPATLPEGIGGTSVAVRVVPAHEVRFAIDLDQARAHYQSIGQSDVTLPERFDGVALVVDTPPAVLQQYRSEEGQDAPAAFGLVLGQAGTLSVSVEGDVTLEELQEFLLDLPGLSPETEEQIMEIEDWQTTVPVPIPVDQINWERATIDGNPGLLLDDNTGLGSAALWQSDGQVFGIVGSMKAEELQRVAESLR